MNSAKGRVILFGVLLALFCSLYYPCRKPTGRFSLMRIHSVLPDRPEYETPQLSAQEEEDVARILSQPFRYFSRGGQCFAFVSGDGKYVIKFFRQRFRPLHAWLAHLPYKPDVLKRKEEKLRSKYHAYNTSAAIAHAKLKQESALLWSHLNKTPTHPKTIKVYDKLGVAHIVDLQPTIFVLQRKGVVSVDYLNELLEQRRIDEVKRSLADMGTLLARRCEKGVYDDDADLYKNMGFLEGKPIFIDIGKFSEMSELRNRGAQEADVHAALVAFHKWLGENRPELLAALD